MVFHIEGAAKSFKNRTLFQDFDLQLAEGEVKAVIGQNGSGKTSFFRGLVGEIPMIYKKRVLPDTSAWSFVRPSPMGFFRNLSGIENLKSFSENTDYSGAIEFLKQMDMSDILQKPQYQLSMGQNSFLHMSRAFLKPNLRFLIIDEVTAHIDEQRKQLLFHYLKEKAQNGLAILVSAQEVSQVEQLTNSIVNIGEKP